MNRRGFLSAMLAAGAAPAVVKAENLMKIFVPPKREIIVQPMFQRTENLAIVSELGLLCADFDGDVISTAQCKALGLTPELVWGSRFEPSFAAAVASNNRQLQEIVHEAQLMIRYPITGVDDLRITSWKPKLVTAQPRSRHF